MAEPIEIQCHRCGYEFMSRAPRRTMCTKCESDPELRMRAVLRGTPEAAGKISPRTGVLSSCFPRILGCNRSMGLTDPIVEGEEGR